MPQYVSPKDYAAIQRMYGAKEAERLAKQYGWQVTLPEEGFTPIGGMGGGDSVDEANTNKVAQVPSGMVDSKTAGAGTPPTGALGALSSEGEYQASQKRFTEQADANLNLLMEAQKALRERRLGPTNREKWFAIAAALGQPTRTGSFGESLGNLNKSLAEIAAERRKAEDAREELGLKYGLEISAQKLRMLQAAANEAGEVYRAELAANKPKSGTWSENMGQFVSPDNPVATQNKVRVGKYTLTKYTDGSLRLKNPDGTYSVYTEDGVKIRDIPAGGAK